MAYQAPTSDIMNTLRCVAPDGAFDEDLWGMIVVEAGKVAGRLAEVNQSGDAIGAKLGESGVAAPDVYREAYAAVREGGWIGLPFPEEVGGQGLPRMLALVVMEMFQAANTSLALAPMLSLGAIEALVAHGSPEQVERYLPKIVSGEWTGTMNLTEPQAGSDVGALKTKAVPNGDGSYAITGQKIFITWGEHDLTDNIIHLVLARLPDAPAGTKGVSLFLCPRRMVEADGSLGAMNAVKCIGLETKIGIHGSPTCVMEYDGATGWLIGEPNRGMAAMFTMMNSARVNVGMQGVGIADAACQEALAYARERKQGAAPGVDGSAAIVRHPDVQQMLTAMRAKTLAARAICYACCAAADEVAAGGEGAKAAKAREDLLTPIAKAWGTDVGVEVASLGVQVHGGMGFMNETLAAQLFRDARIGPIYEGTNGIQAIDLVGRKLAGDKGAAMKAMLADVNATAEAARASNDAALSRAGRGLERGARELEAASAWMVETFAADRAKALYAATRYQSFAAEVIGGHYLTKMALDAAERGAAEAGELASLAAFHAASALGVVDVTELLQVAAEASGNLAGGLVDA